MAETLLRQAEVQRRTKLGRTTLWRLERAGDFPRRRQITGTTIGWIESEVEEWISSRPKVGEAAGSPK